ncbi:MAG: hypothetical protein ACPIG6_06280 [Akkermansiaceae bacterium]
MSTNDITGDELRTKPSTEVYRGNYDRIFRKPARPGYKDVVQLYKKIGCANSSSFTLPEGGDWRRCHQNASGCYEVFCSDELRQYYDQYSD